MKFTIRRQFFITHLANVSRAITTRTTIPILTGVYLEANERGLQLIGSDSSISIESRLSIQDDSIQLTIESTGSVVLPSRLFGEVIKKLPTEFVTIEVDHNHLTTIVSGKAVFQINGFDGELYPKLPEVDTSQKIELPTLLFKQLIQQTIFSASNQETRPMLTGLNLTLNPTFLTAVATDSHRLSKREINIQANTNNLPEYPVTIPRKVVIELSKIIEENNSLYIAIVGNQVIFLMDHLTIYSRLLEGAYPDVSRLIPTTHQTELIVQASNFIQAIERASLLAHEGKNNVVQLELSADKVELSVRGLEVGRVAEEINIESITGEELTISFNPDYMRDALKSFGDNTIVNIKFQSAVRPLLLSFATKSELDNNELIQLLTPIRSHYV